jgi:hypothetical protein
VIDIIVNISTPKAGAATCSKASLNKYRQNRVWR